MTDEATPERLRQQLNDIAAQLAELHRLVDDVQARRGRDSPGAVGFEEPEDIATDLTGLAETQAVIAELEIRRETVEERLRALT